MGADHLAAGGPEGRDGVSRPGKGLGRRRRGEQSDQADDDHRDRGHQRDGDSQSLR
ncbi:MAG: hypothetical protein M3N98_09645 [Actinomycetota bacterium]|nr:hypothetical protein [Actinomycetota bacterium]